MENSHHFCALRPGFEADWSPDQSVFSSPQERCSTWNSCEAITAVVMFHVEHLPRCGDLLREAVGLPSNVLRALPAALDG